MKILAIVILCFALVGCGGGGQSTTPTTSTTPQQASFQTGQWEFSVQSTNSNPTIFVESDETATPVGAIGSYVTATDLFWNQTGGYIAGLYDSCSNYQTTLSVSGNTVTGLLFAGSTQIAHTTATLSADGKSMSGTFQLDGVTAFCAAPVTTSGTFSGQLVAPLGGTYKGSLSDGSALTVQLTQNSRFGITVAGTSLLSGSTTNIAIQPTSGTNVLNDVIGATVSGLGTATNVNGSQSFQVFGHFNSDASQISFATFSGQQWASGTLTKQ
jgi:hypothetical protein